MDVTIIGCGYVGNNPPRGRERAARRDRERMLGAEVLSKPFGVGGDEREVLGDSVMEIADQPSSLRRKY